jgi:hypothetical protein
MRFRLCNKRRAAFGKNMSLSHAHFGAPGVPPESFEIKSLFFMLPKPPIRDFLCVRIIPGPA